MSAQVDRAERIAQAIAQSQALCAKICASADRMIERKTTIIKALEK
jgi:hypothetical protein